MPFLWNYESNENKEQVYKVNSFSKKSTEMFENQTQFQMKCHLNTVSDVKETDLLCKSWVYF